MVLLHGQWEQRVRVSELAQRVGLGASRLEHLFKTHAKINIRDFVREQRLLRAAELLRRTEERIAVIREQVGFHDASNFNHAFKKRFGVGPRRFREQGYEEGTTFDQEPAEGTK